MQIDVMGVTWDVEYTIDSENEAELFWVQAGGVTWYYKGAAFNFMGLMQQQEIKKAIDDYRWCESQVSRREVR